MTGPCEAGEWTSGSDSAPDPECFTFSEGRRIIICLKRPERICMSKKKEKDVKTNVMRILDRQKVNYEVLTYEVPEFEDG